MPNDLMTTLFLWMLLGGAVLCAWLMALISHGEAFGFDALLLKHGRRASLAAVALGFLWGAKFCVEQAWAPWPPCVLTTFGVDLYLSISLLSAYRRQRVAPRVIRLPRVVARR